MAPVWNGAARARRRTPATRPARDWLAGGAQPGSAPERPAPGSAGRPDSRREAARGAVARSGVGAEAQAGRARTATGDSMVLTSRSDCAAPSSRRREAVVINARLPKLGGGKRASARQEERRKVATRGEPKLERHNRENRPLSLPPPPFEATEAHGWPLAPRESSLRTRSTPPKKHHAHPQEEPPGGVSLSLQGCVPATRASVPRLQSAGAERLAFARYGPPQCCKP